MRPRRIAAGLAGALALLAAAPGRAQPAPADDWDDRAAAHSDFWDHAARPHGEAYDAAVRRAQLLIESNTAQQLAEAEPLLVDAISLEPKNPLAYWWLGELHARLEKWPDCAKARQQVFDLAPDFRSPSPRDDPMFALDLGLAACLGNAGDYEGALLHLKRILAAGGVRRYDVSWRLGNAYMALGRIGEAIEAYEAAYRLRPGADYPMLDFVLAVAYDRDEQSALSRDHLDQALTRDPRLSSLVAPPVPYQPDADEEYFLALANRALGRRALAIHRFRRYLSLAGGAPWTRRARAHLTALAHSKPSPDEVTVRVASATVDEKVVDAAVLGAYDGLARCLGDTPNILAKVRIVVHARPDRAHRSHPPAGVRLVEPLAPAAGVRVSSERDFDTSVEAIGTSIHCLEEAARKVSIPAPPGFPHGYLIVELYVVAD